VTTGAGGAAREPGGVRAVLSAWPAIAGALAFRYAAYAAMTAMALWAELRPAPTLPDLLLARLPYVAWIDRVNYWLWLGVYVPLAALLLWRQPRRWVRYMVTGGLVSLARGASIALTGLGPPDPAHAGPGIGGRSFSEAYAELLSPVGVFDRGAIAAYLTKDLFFSGHVATTFLLWLYLRGHSRLAPVALAASLVVTASVLLAHLHYSIDVVGAWAVTFAIFVLREGWPARRAVPPGAAT
jgi:membrane-associated phospholipid phosphatase